MRVALREYEGGFRLDMIKTIAQMHKVIKE